MKSPVSFIRLTLSVLLLVLISGVSIVTAQDEYASVKKWETFSFAKNSVTPADVEQHETVQPGDMRLYENRALTRKKLGSHTNAEWTVLASEIEAIHGKRFDGTPWLQQYFDERYWYRPADKYNAKSLSEIEQK